MIGPSARKTDELVTAGSEVVRIAATAGVLAVRMIPSATMLPLAPLALSATVIAPFVTV